MTFGLGGGGGVINRVTKDAQWLPTRSLSLTGGNFDQRRTTLDVGQGLSAHVATRLNALYENSAGFRRLGIGALFGLADWRREALSVAAHAQYLLRHCWKAQVTISLPRLRPCAGEFQPLTTMSDRELVQLVAAFRLLLPDAGLVLSTREPAALRDGLLPLGITLASAGSHTEPGGYTGAGRENIHRTERGRIVELAAGASEWATTAGRETNATGQFEIADERSPEEIANLIRRLGYEPVWKDWDAALSA